MKLTAPLVLSLCVLASVSCGGNDSPVAPAKVIMVPECEKNHTAVLTITNNAANLLPREVQIDGVVYGLLAWQESRSFTLSSGVGHNISFRSPISGQVVSLSQGLILNQCSTFTLNNTYTDGTKVQE